LILEAAITSKGQAIIPKPVLKHLGLKAGDRVKFFFHPDGSVALLPKRPSAELRGLLERQDRVVALEPQSSSIESSGS
jgi:AbrB family looped-hinge helix DNA binding protein